jgi:hypothetical protein
MAGFFRRTWTPAQATQMNFPTGSQIGQIPCLEVGPPRVLDLGALPCLALGNGACC